MKNMGFPAFAPLNPCISFSCIFAVSRRKAFILKSRYARTRFCNRKAHFFRRAVAVYFAIVATVELGRRAQS